MPAENHDSLTIHSKENFVKNILLILFILSTSLSPALAQRAQPSDASIADLMKITNASSMMDTTMQNLHALMRTNFAQMTKGQSMTSQQKQILDDMQSQIAAMLSSELRWEKLEPSIIGTYRRTFTQKEIDDMLVFYKSETGRAVIQKMPVVIQASTQSMEGVIANLMPRFEKIQKEALDRLHATRNSSSR